jgi:hypothetical protein
MFDASVIKKTGQWWKAVVSFWVLMLGGAAMLWGLSNLSSSTPSYTSALAISGMILAALGFAYACLSIRCPVCGARWVWMGASGKSSVEWLSWLLSRSECPRCRPE